MKIISLGLGVQSTWLYLASSMGILPKVEAAIFVDTGKEKKKTLEYLEWLTQWAHNNSNIPIIICKEKNLYADLLSNDKYVKIPAYTKNNDRSIGMLQRQCTTDYKIYIVDKAIRSLLGLKKGERIKTKVELWKGISLDEIDRMSIPAEKWKISVYPFCGYQVPGKGNAEKIDWATKMTRIQIINEYGKNNFPIPPKSSCVFCPYQSDQAWYNMKVNEPEDFEAAIKVDEAIRNSTKKGIIAPAYLHDSCRPLAEVDFSVQAPDLWKGECSGTCHI